MKTLDHNDLGCYMHTALRKLCDSTVTSLAYNLIYAAGEEWNYFLKIFHENLPETKDLAELAQYAEALVEKMGPCEEFWPDREVFNEDSLKQKGINKTMYLSLLLTFELFDQDDWKPALAYCIEE